MISNTSALTLSAPISGSGGLTLFSPTVAAVTISGASTYTGTTTHPGQPGPSSPAAVANDGVTTGPFGLSTTPVVLNAGLGYALLASTANTTFSRNLLVAGAASPGLDYFGGTAGLTMNGNIDMEHSLTIYAGTTTATGVVINGNISGPGTFQGFGTGANVTLNGNNTFTGGVNTQGDAYTLGSDTAFGTGTIYTSASSTFQGAGTATRTIANNWIFLATPTYAGTAPLTLSGTMNLNGARTITVSNTAGTTISGVVSNGSVTKGGAGAVFFNSATGNTFTGGFTNTGSATTASAIYANNTSGSAFGTGAVNVGAASATVFSTLAGNFTTSGNTSIAGRLSPGNGTGLTAATAGIGSIGTMNFGGTLLLSSATTSSLYLEIASGTSTDVINVTGALTLAGTVNLATTNGYSIHLGDSFDVVNAASITPGTITYITTNATVDPGVTLTESIVALPSGGSELLVTAVPEPTTVLGGVLTAGLLGLGLRRRARLLATR